MVTITTYLINSVLQNYFQALNPALSALLTNLALPLRGNEPRSFQVTTAKQAIYDYDDGELKQCRERAKTLKEEVHADMLNHREPHPDIESDELTEKMNILAKEEQEETADEPANMTVEKLIYILEAKIRAENTQLEAGREWAIMTSRKKVKQSNKADLRQRRKQSCQHHHRLQTHQSPPTAENDTPGLNGVKQNPIIEKIHALSSSISDDIASIDLPRRCHRSRPFHIRQACQGSA